MNADVRDIHQTLEYQTATAIVRLLPLIGIAAVATNLAGLWDLPRQAKDREARNKARAKILGGFAKRLKEESKQRKADEETRRREFEEKMRRAFGR